MAAHTIRNIRAPDSSTKCQGSWSLPGPSSRHGKQLNDMCRSNSRTCPKATTNDIPCEPRSRPSLTDHDPSCYGPAYSVPSRWRTYPVLLALPNKVFTSFPSHRTEYIQHFSKLQDTLISRHATHIHYSMRICSSAPRFPRKMMNSIRGQHPSHSLLFYWKIPFSFTHLWVFTPLATDE